MAFVLADGIQILDKIDESMVSPSGGFGPVADDGYGVSYMIASDDQVGEPCACCLGGGLKCL